MSERKQPMVECIGGPIDGRNVRYEGPKLYVPRVGRRTNTGEQEPDAVYKFQGFSDQQALKGHYVFEGHQ